MSKRHRGNKSRHNNDNNVQRFRVDLDSWRRFQSFMDNWNLVKDSINELEEGWKNHVKFLIEDLACYSSEFEGMYDSISALRDSLNKCQAKTVTKSHKYNPAPPKKKCKPGACIAEISISDVSEGDDIL